MSRLYQYADSNDKSGLFLLDGYKGRNTTFQITKNAEKLLYHLDYEPGIRNQARGPRIPDEIQWCLFEIGWVYTNESGITPPTNKEGDIIIEDEDVEINEKIAGALRSFLEEMEDDVEGLEELVELLDIDMDSSISRDQQTSTQTQICDLSESRCQEIAEMVATHLEIETNPGTESEWGITYVTGGRINSNTNSHQIIIKIDHRSGRQYFHKAIFSSEEGFKGVWTTTNQSANWEQRSHLEKHRGKIIEAIISIAKSEHLDIGDPMLDLYLTTGHEPSIEQFGGDMG